MNAFTPEQYQQRLNKYLIYAAQQLHKNITYHSAGIEYTSLMVSFMLFNISACESLLKLATSFSNDWYPVSVGYIIDRSIFEVLINAHYISKEPKTRSIQYIEYDKIVRKKQLDNFRKHKQTNDSSWQEFINSALVHELEPRAITIESEYERVKSQYKRSRKGRQIPYENWAGKTIRDMAREVNHEIEYDLLYSELSSFAHANVKLADQFLKNDTLGLYWSQRPGESHLGNVFRYATTFFPCFLELFGREFGVWTEREIRKFQEGIDVTLD